MGTVGTSSPLRFILPHPTLHIIHFSLLIVTLNKILWVKMVSSSSLLIVFIASASALPFPQLTEEQFSARARSLDEPNNVLITNSYTQVRRQGRMGAEDNIKFPTLEVRNPNELSRGPVQNKLFIRGPVYKKSTADIEEKIREINLAVEAKIEEQENKLQVEEPTVKEVEEVIDTLTDLAAIEVVAEEIAEAAIMADDIEEVEEEIVEQVKEELAEELAMVEMVKEAVIDEAEADAVEENIIEEESEVTTVGPSEDEVDFGDITEVAV